jgi:hypothetical protein
MDFQCHEQRSIKHGILQQWISSFVSSVLSTEFCSNGFRVLWAEFWARNSAATDFQFHEQRSKHAILQQWISNFVQNILWNRNFSLVFFHATRGINLVAQDATTPQDAATRFPRMQFCDLRCSSWRVLDVYFAVSWMLIFSRSCWTAKRSSQIAFCKTIWSQKGDPVISVRFWRFVIR